MSCGHGSMIFCSDLRSTFVEYGDMPNCISWNSGPGIRVDIFFIAMSRLVSVFFVTLGVRVGNEKRTVQCWSIALNVHMLLSRLKKIIVDPMQPETMPVPLI